MRRSFGVKLLKATKNFFNIQMSYVVINNLTKTFDGFLSKSRLVAVDDVSLEIQKGEILGLLGVNGAGKTTMLKMICGLLKPTRGEIRINGLELEKHRSTLLNRISAVLEGSRNSLWSMTVRQNLTYFGFLKHTHGHLLKDRGSELLHFFQLDHKENEVVKNLSKGMKQKLAIVLAFISDPDLILLDEPTLGLDVRTAKLVKQRLVQLARQKRKTVLLTSHQIEMVEEICDRVAIINQGKIIALDRTDKLLKQMDREQYVFEFEKPRDLPALEDVPEFNGCELIPAPGDGGHLSLRLVVDHRADLSRALDAFKKHNLSILSISRSKPSLENIFVKMTESPREP